MEKIVLKDLDEIIYYDECDNGLKIYVWSNPRVNMFMGSLNIQVGSEDNKYTINYQKKQVPYGTAHYLEHIICKNGNGTSLLQDFRKLGSYSNASTFGYRTSYEFAGSSNLYENINLLLNSVQNKRFYEKIFESERTPIKEEARMYSDDPGRVLHLKVNESLFRQYPNRKPGTGNLEDIDKITIKDIKKIYKDFYHPENSFIVITGNVDAEKVIACIKENQHQKVFPPYKNPKKKEYIEPTEVASSFISVKTNVEIPEIITSVKIPEKLFKDIDSYEVANAISVTLSSNFGPTSKFREELVNEKLITSLYSQYYLDREYWLMQIVCKTKYPEEMIKRITDKIENLEFDNEDIIRKKKSKIANIIRSYEDVENVNNYISYKISKMGEICQNEKEMLEKMSVSKVKEIFKRIPINNSSTVLALPKKGKY